MIQLYASCEAPLGKKSQLRYHELVKLHNKVSFRSSRQVFIDNIEVVFRLPLLVRAAWCLMDYERAFLDFVRLKTFLLRGAYTPRKTYFLLN